MQDHHKQEGIFAKPLQIAHSHGSLPRAASAASPVFPSPFDTVLSLLHLQPVEVLSAANTLSMPLSTLLWGHSVTLLLQESRICSWNTILNYPSLITQFDSPSSQDSSDSFDSKRRRKGSLPSDSTPSTTANTASTTVNTASTTVNTNTASTASTVKTEQRLTTILSQCYFAAKNPYAAMSLVQAEQLDQQLLIQCTTQRNGFTAAYQLLAAYSAFYENSEVIAKADEAINPALRDEGAQLWQTWPWKQLSQWKTMTKKETLACFEQSLDTELLRLEMREQQARRAKSIPFTGFLSEQLTVLLKKERGGKYSE